MLKKILLASAMLIAGTGIAVASPAPYVGVSTGIINNTANVKINGTTFTGGAYRGVPFNVFAGYGGVVNQNFYLAGEVSGTVATANISDNTQLKTSYGYGASVIPGVMLSEHTLAYGRAGVVRSRFSNGDGSTKTGGQFGLGMQTCLTQNVDLRGEYDFVAYQSKNYNLGGGTTASVAPRSDQFTVGLVYKFD